MRFGVSCETESTRSSAFTLSNKTLFEYFRLIISGDDMPRVIFAAVVLLAAFADGPKLALTPHLSAKQRISAFPGAIANVGGMYEFGQGAPQDKAEAASLYRKASYLGDAQSRRHIFERRTRLSAQRRSHSPLRQDHRSGQSDCDVLSYDFSCEQVEEEPLGRGSQPSRQRRGTDRRDAGHLMGRVRV